MSDIVNKSERLKNYLITLKSAAVAFSGGVDSTFLLKVARDVLGDKVIALTAENIFVPRNEVEFTKKFCDTENIRQIIFTSDVLAIEGVAENPVNRCYLCKRGLFKNFLRLAKENNLSEVVEGSNMDDNADYRPGMKALEELNIKSPLRIAELYKSEIRELSLSMNLLTATKSSMACLATRFPYGEKLTEKNLAMAESAENFLFDSGFKQLRVRVHGKIARIEILTEDFTKFMKIRENVVTQFKLLGFDYVTLDLQGYRSGSMNIGLKSQ